MRGFDIRKLININKESKKTMMLVALLTSIATLICLLFQEANILFIANIILMLLILIKAKFSYFSMKTILMNYVLIAVFFQYTTGKSYGILENTSLNLHYVEINTLIYIYNAISYIWISCTDILNKEKDLLKENFRIRKLSTYLCCAGAILAAIIAFPGAPFDMEYTSNRFQGLLPGNAWNHISMVCLLFLLPKFRRSNIVKITYAFVMFWFLSHYERVDVIGLIFFCLIYFFAKKEKIKLKTYIIVGIMAISTVFTMVYIGEARVNNQKNISIVDIFRKVLVQNTAADIGYVFNTSIEYAKNEKLLIGKTYSTYVLELLPFVDTELRADKILNQKYSTPGGEFILSEPIINFGLLGGIIFQFVEFGIYTIILSKKNKYRFLVYCFLMMTVFRTNWYGWLYIEKAMVYFIPILYFATKYLDNKELKNEKSKKENQDKIKVLFYCEKWDSGGIEAFIMNIYRNLNREKIKADILTSQNETDIYDDEIKEFGGNKYVTLKKKYNSPILRTLVNFMQFTTTIRKMDYDIIHLNICNGVAIIYAYLAKVAGIKYVVLHSHNTNVGNTNKNIKQFGHKICKYLFEQYGDEYFACSDLAADWLYTKETVDSGKVKIINNAIDATKFIFDEQERKKFRKELNIDEKFVIGHIGRFSEQKNHNYLIDIFKEINNINKNSVLLLVGDGELKNDVIKKVNELGLKEDVIFYGVTKEIPKVLWSMDVFVLPSLFEGKPVVGIETQAAAVKSYVSDTITKTLKISEYIEYLDINSEPKEWAKRIIEEGKNYDRKNMYDIILKNNYDIKGVAKNIEEIYFNLIKNM